MARSLAPSQRLSTLSIIFLAVLGVLLTLEVFWAYLIKGLGCTDLYVWPYFIYDLAKGTLCWQAWTLPASGYLFPSLPFYALCWVICQGNANIALLLQMILYAWLFAILTKLIFQLFLKWPVLDSWIGGLGITIILDNLLVFPWGLQQGLLLPQCHGGTALVTLAGALLVCRCWQNPALWLLWTVGALTGLGAFGDKIFILWFSAPAVLVALLYRKWGLLTTLLGATLLGGLTAYFITPDASSAYMPNGEWQLIEETHLLRGIPAFWRDIQSPNSYPWMAFIMFCGLIIGSWLLWKHRKHLPWWALGAASMMVAPFILSMALQTYEGLDNWRHFPFCVLFPLILFAVLLKKASTHWKAFLSFLAIGMFAFEVLYVHESDSSPKDTPSGYLGILSKKGFYSRQMDDIAMIRKQLHLQDGLASYWICKQNTLQSKGAIFLAPIWRDGRIVSCMTTLRDFEGHHFNYILVNNLSAEKLMKHFGTPLNIYEVHHQGDSYGVLIYADGVLDKAIASDKTLIQIKKDRHLTTP